MEHNFQAATQRAESFSSHLDEANAVISALQNQVDKLHGQLEAMQEKHLDYIKDKLEADAATQLREAAISVLKLKIFALEGDLQKEVFLRVNRLPDSQLKYLSQFSPAIDVEVRPNRSGSHNNIPQTDRLNTRCSTDVNVESPKKQQDELFEGSTMSIRTHPEMEEVILADKLKTDSWSTERKRKLEPTVAKAHQKYILLSQDQVMQEPMVKSVNASGVNSFGCYGIQPSLCFRDELPWKDVSPSEHAQSHARHQNSFCITDDESASENSSDIVNQFLGDNNSQFVPSKFVVTRNGLFM